jgi:hypothetical protein
MKVSSTLGLACLLLAGLPVSGHHSSAAYFDMSKTVTVTGTVTQVLWVNPHVILLVKSTNENGQSKNWALHGLAPNALSRLTPREKFKEGLSISAEGHPTRTGIQAGTIASSLASQSGVHVVEAGEIRLSTGEVLGFGRGPGFRGLR